MPLIDRRRWSQLLFSLRGRMVLLVAAAILPAVMLAVFVARQADQEQDRAARDEALRLSLLVAQQQDETLLGVRRLLDILASLPSSRGDDAEACARLLASQIGDGSIYANLVVVDGDGRPVCGARDLALAEGRFEDRAWLDAVTGAGFGVGAFSEIGHRPQPVLPVAVPRPEENGRRLIVAELSLEALGELLGEVIVPERAAITLVDRGGVVLAHSPAGDLGPGSAYPNTELATGALESRVDVVELPSADGREQFFGISTLSHGDIRAIVRMERPSALLGLLGAEMWPLVWLALAQVFILLSIAVAARRWVLRPIEALALAAARLTEGELAARSGLDPYGRDEIGRLARVFDRMADSQQHRQEALEVRGARAEARLRAALWASETGTFHWDLRSNILEYDQNLARLFGLSANERAESLEDFALRVHPEDREQVQEAMQRCAGEGADFDSEFRVVWPDGSVRWLDDKGKTFSDSSGRPVSLTGACIDITERKRAEERQQLLMGELNHRVKNMLATVQSIMVQTLQRSDGLEDFARSFEGRVAALAHAHDLLTQGRWEAAELRDLAAQVVSPYQAAEGPSVVLDGPEVALRPKAALTLTLVLHELATNAGKHGALSEPDGRVELRWREIDGADGRLLQVDWRESGGPPVRAPSRRGFGLSLIERSIDYDLGGDGEVAFEADGLRCRLRLPVAGNVLPGSLAPARRST
jgi:PAS domain S-box-containing protein